MEKYDVQPLDLMQFINSKYHDPYIHERIELDGRLDAERFIRAIGELISVFPVFGCYYDETENAFIKSVKINAKELFTILEKDDRKGFRHRRWMCMRNLYTLLWRMRFSISP